MTKPKYISTLKFIAATAIVGTAGLIMFPMLAAFAFGLGRIAIWVVLILVAASAIRYVWSVVSAYRDKLSASHKLIMSGVAATMTIQFCCAAAMAQGQMPVPADDVLIIPAGTTLEGRIDTKVGSAVSKAGQQFHIVMASPVLANGSTVLIPAGARVLGEVVEAIPASHVYRAKGEIKPKGKLRVQLTALELPGGAVFPMVASLTAEASGTRHRQSENPNLGHGVGYLGTSAGFNAVTPRSQYNVVGRTIKPQLATRDQMLHDPLYGVSQPAPGSGYGSHPVYRSLKQRGNDLIIDLGSPLSIKLDAALKIPIDAITQGSESIAPSATSQVETKHDKHRTEDQPHPAALPLPAPPVPDATGDPGF